MTEIDPLIMNGVEYDGQELRQLHFRGIGEVIEADNDLEVTAGSSGVSVDVAEGSCFVEGDDVTEQGFYRCRNGATVNSADFELGGISGADPTDPRIDRIIAQVKDNAHDASGLKKWRLEVIAGTPTAGATLINLNGAAALPTSAKLLANVRIDAGEAGPLVASDIGDQRRRYSGKSIIDAEDSRTDTAFGTLPTPDIVRNVVLEADGLIFVHYKSAWRNSVGGAGRAAIFLDAVQLQSRDTVLTVVGDQEADCNGVGDWYSHLSSCGFGLIGGSGSAAAKPAEPTTGMTVGAIFEDSGIARIGSTTFLNATGFGGLCAIYAAAGTYDVSIQFKASSGAIKAVDRKLFVSSRDFDQVFR